MRKRRNGAFTLIELLVVIAIIVVLAAILFPVFARARENARRSSCQSNLKQIGLGIMQYTQDYDEIMPGAWYGSSSVASDATNYKWMDVIQPYVKSEQLFACPSASNYKYVRQSGSNYGGYVINNAYWQKTATRQPPVSDFGNSGAPYTTSLAAIQASSTTVLATDREPLSSRAIAETYAIFWEVTPPSITGTNPRQLDNLAERHLNTVNTLFCDGHVKSMKLDTLVKTDAAGTMTAFTIQDD
jgi:prepilin-type N-terminal cleavage/methylation domain-containing protein/prepilin-type processing-associated H-X9-DG protein